MHAEDWIVAEHTPSDLPHVFRRLIQFVEGPQIQGALLTVGDYTRSLLTQPPRTVDNAIDKVIELQPLMELEH